MDPIYPWLDPAEVRRLADHLMRPHREPATPVTDLGFDGGFVGYEASHPPQPVTPPPATQAHDAHLPTPPPMPIISVSPENPSAARGPLLERITRFRDWMRIHFSASGIFILNGEGNVIFDEGLNGRLHFLARSLALASRRPGTTVGNVHVKISATSILEIIPVETAHGYLVLGAVVPDSLDPKAITAITNALGQVATPPGEG